MTGKQSSGSEYHERMRAVREGRSLECAEDIEEEVARLRRWVRNNLNDGKRGPN